MASVLLAGCELLRTVKCECAYPGLRVIMQPDAAGECDRRRLVLGGVCSNQSTGGWNREGECVFDLDYVYQEGACIITATRLDGTVETREVEYRDVDGGDSECQCHSIFPVERELRIE